MSIDGYIDDATTRRLLLSNEDDFDRVDAVRASCDAIMVGARTIRGDNPRLLVRSSTRREARLGRGLPASPMKVTVTGGGRLDPAAAFFTAGAGGRLVYCPSRCVNGARERFGDVATVVDGGPRVLMAALSEDLHARGVRRLMVEGGAQIHTQFLAEGLADELQLLVAPFFVGDSKAPRLAGDGAFPWHSGRPARLAEVQAIGDAVLLRYALSGRFDAGAGG